MERGTLPRLQKFNHEPYIKVTEDFRAKPGVPYAKLTDQGIDLAATYYADKYHMEKLTRMGSTNQFVEAINSKEFIKKIRQSDGDVRVPFSISSLVQVRRMEMVNAHSTPALYIKEADQEAILYFDSLGSTTAAEEIAKKTGMKVYTTNTLRQTDFYSCHVDMLVFARELTGKNKNGDYLMPSVLAAFEKRANNKDANPVTVTLPNNLLITAQQEKFVSANKESATIAHRGKHGPETYDMFAARFKETADFGHAAIQPATSYLRKKGLDLANIIEIQFYLNQLEVVLGHQFNKQFRDHFVAAAKIELASQGPVTVENMKNRAGLYQFSQKMMAQALQIEWKDEPAILKRQPISTAYSFDTFTHTRTTTEKKANEPVNYADYFTRVLERQRKEDEIINATLSKNVASKPVSDSPHSVTHKDMASPLLLFPNLGKQAETYANDKIYGETPFNQLLTKLTNSIAEKTPKSGSGKTTFENLLKQIIELRVGAKNNLEKIFKESKSVENIDAQMAGNIELDCLTKIGSAIQTASGKNKVLNTIYIQFITDIAHLSSQNRPKKS